MKAMIFAAGLGTRLRPLTDTMPKALVKVGGVPMLEIVIRRLMAAGIREFVVNAHHFHTQIEDFLRENGDFGADITLSLEMPEPLETGGGIRKAAAALSGSGPFLVHNADILSDLDLPAFMAAARPGALATLVVSKRNTTRYLLFDDDMRLVGWTNVVTGEVKSPYPALDPAACRKYSFAGIHIIAEEALALMESWPEKFSIIDFYLAQAAAHPIYGWEPESLNLVDVGSPERLEEAQVLYSSIYTSSPGTEK
ncbi:MAG: nucleotidyltransferase family protein [Bacteroidales bacterium]|nr:nucleotidyltransferase family protein [Bacteroidales bacterium]